MTPVRFRGTPRSSPTRHVRQRGGEEEVKYLLGVLDRVNDVPDEAELSEGTRAARLPLSGLQTRSCNLL